MTEKKTRRVQNNSFGRFMEECESKSGGMISGPEMLALYESNLSITSGTDSEARPAGLLAIDRIIERANDFFVHPVTFKTLDNAKLLHDDWVKSRQLNGHEVPSGITSHCSPFITQYLIDVCEDTVHDATEKLIDIFIVSPRTYQLPELLSSTCNPQNIVKASDLISKWWAALTLDGLDDTQILRTLSGERRKNPDDTILLGDLAFRLLNKDNAISAELDRVRQQVPGPQSSSEDLLRWVNESGVLEGKRQAINEIAKELE